MSRAKRPVLARVSHLIDFDGADGCWLFVGYRTPQGYGQVWDGEHRNAFVHRVVFEQWYGPVPSDLVLDHICRVRACCNPEHLEPVTQAENIARGESPRAKANRAGHCKKGHVWSEASTYRKTNGGRECLICRRARAREWMAASRRSVKW